jgi:ATP-binding cassette subfamily B protein
MSHLQDLRAELPRMPPHLTGLRAVFLVAIHHGLQIGAEDLVNAAGFIQENPGSLEQVMGRLIRQTGLRAKKLKQQGWAEVTSLGSAYPALALRHDGGWMIVVGALGTGDDMRLAILDPAHEALGLKIVERLVFQKEWSGTLILLKPRKVADAQAPPFGLGWFLREILHYKGFMRDVGIAAIASNLIALATPLMYQVIINKVVPYRALQTLTTIVLIFLTCTAFDAAFTYVRQRLMLFVSIKVDAKVGARVFARLLSLPMPFFEHTTAGVLTRNMQQTEKLRHFLTGRLFQTMLDCTALPVLICLLLSYSMMLSAIVLGFSLCIAAVIAILIPVFKNCLNQLYQAEGMRQALLVETLHGMRTIKSLAMEPVRQAEWDNRIAASARRLAVVGRVGAGAAVLTNGLDKMMQISVMGIGAQAVFTGSLSIGALVAFTMLASRVSGPLLQVVALVNEYQEVALGVKMLATIMDHPPERAPDAQTITPDIRGGIEFDNVSFRYPGASGSALDQVSFAVKEGEMIGVVGRSGSGKTTLIRMIQGIQSAQLGTIRLSGTDIRHIDLGHLRRNVAVVLQDSFLFRGTIRDNIAAGLPQARLEAIVEAARLAGAEEFIDRLPLGYETVIEEGATNFSGGQRQRLSIARALLIRPRLLIFDEATSALDPESEAILQANLKEIARGRTMIVVSHRLSSLVQSDRILVLERSRVVDFAPHAELVERCDAYRSLWQQQTQHVHV